MNKIFTGKRKSAVCRLFLTEDLNRVVNRKTFGEYFGNIYFSYYIEDLISSSRDGIYGFKCNVRGGGLFAQADAIKYALAKAILGRYKDKLTSEEFKIEKKILRQKGFITVDTRKVEPKRAGNRKSRAKRMRSKR